VADDLTLHEAAELLGVHYMTAYRYVRLGQLPAEKLGGVWRVSRDEVERLRDGVSEAPVAATAGGRRRAPWAGRLESRLLAGDARGAWGVVEAALTAGTEPDQVYLDVLAPAMASIGDRWERGEIDVSIEHRASVIAMRLIGRLGPRFVRRGRTRGVVVLGAPPGEHHSLPIALAADLVRQHGWEVSDIGADVPEASFVHAALTTPDVVAVGLSVTLTDHLPAARSVLAALREATSGVLLAVGGMAVQSEAEAVALGADVVATDIARFVELLEARTTGKMRATGTS
jgi:excisionase family DNA binding protein